MEAVGEELELRLGKEIRERTRKSQSATMNVLQEVGGTVQMFNFYGIRYNNTVRVCQSRSQDEPPQYTGGTQEDHQRNISLFQKVNGLVLDYMAEGSSYLDRQKIPQFLREAIIKHTAD